MKPWKGTENEKSNVAHDGPSTNSSPENKKITEKEGRNKVTSYTGRSQLKGVKDNDILLAQPTGQQSTLKKKYTRGVIDNVEKKKTQKKRNSETSLEKKNLMHKKKRGGNSKLVGKCCRTNVKEEDGLHPIAEERGYEDGAEVLRILTPEGI